MRSWGVWTVACAAVLSVVVWAAVAAVRRDLIRREEDRVPKLPVPREVTAAASDPDNAYPEYFAIRQSRVRLILNREGDDLRDAAWAPGPDLAKLLGQVRPEIDRALAATHRKRCDLAPSNGVAQDIDPQVTGTSRLLLVVEGRRRRASGSIEGAGDCVVAILRIARQVRSHEDPMSFAVCMSSSRIACKEASFVLDVGAFTEGQRDEALSIIKDLLAVPLSKEPTEVDRLSHPEVMASLRALRDRLGSQGSKGG